MAAASLRLRGRQPRGLCRTPAPLPGVFSLKNKMTVPLKNATGPDSGWGTMGAQLLTPMAQ